MTEYIFNHFAVIFMICIPIYTTAYIVFESSKTFTIKLKPMKKPIKSTLLFLTGFVAVWVLFFIPFAIGKWNVHLSTWGDERGLYATLSFLFGLVGGGGLVAIYHED